MKGIGKEPIYGVMPLKGKKKRAPARFMGQKKVTKKLDLGEQNDFDSVSVGGMSDRGPDTNRKLIDDDAE